MTLYFFEGPAGSGKTTALINQVKTHLKTNPLLDGQNVLGLTMMHGARRRLHDKLYAEIELKGRFICSTFDSFAWRIVNRWRSLLFHLDTEYPQTYEETCRAASTLLSLEIVRKWVSRTNPLVLVDEAQDCKGGRLGILQALTHSSTVFVAADEFQDLYNTERSESVIWLQSVSASTAFSANHRTSVHGLLLASSLLRNGERISRSKDCDIKEVPSHHVAAHLSAYYLLNNRQRTVAILSPTRPKNSLFVQNTVSVLTKGGIKLKNNPQPLQPFKINWETDFSDLEQTIKKEINMPDDTSLYVDLDTLQLSSSTLGGQQLQTWIKQQQALTGTRSFSAQEISNQITNICRQLRAYSTNRTSNIQAMTIHQAKNQEFDCVIVLWPYEIGVNEEFNRRLLYNAITRAKRSCVILVQGTGRRTRLNKPPFKTEI